MNEVETENLQQIQEFFRLDSEELDDLKINAFLNDCQTAKTKYFEGVQTSSFSVQPKTLSEIIQTDLDKQSIIPDSGQINPVGQVDHLPPNLQSRLNGIFLEYKDLFSKHKHHIGRFVGFKAEANIDFSKKINCKQPPRNRVCHQAVNKIFLNTKMLDSLQILPEWRTIFAVTLLLFSVIKLMSKISPPKRTRISPNIPNLLS